MPRLGPSHGGGGERREAEVVEPGQHVIALRWFQRKQAEASSKDYLSGLFEIVGGPLKGKCFWATRSLDFDKESTVKFWQSYIDAVGCREEIELGDSNENTDGQGDANIRRVFRGKPVVAEVTQDPFGDRIQNGIKFLVFRSKWTDEQRAWAQQYLDKSGGQRDPAEDAEPPPDDGYVPQDEDAPPPARGRAQDDWDDPPRGRSGSGRPYGGGQMGEDDDIPF